MDEALREEQPGEGPAADRACGERPAGALLADAYRRDRDRERAVRWLGWVAYQWGSEPVAWWEIPARIPGRRLARVRFAAAVVIVAVAFGAATGFTFWVAAFTLLLGIGVWGGTGMHMPRARPLRIPQPGTPRRVKPRWPRGWGEVALLTVSLIPVVTFPPVLLRQWTGPADGDPVRTYRSDRLAAGARFAAWLGSGGLIVVVALGAGAPAGAWLGVDLSLAAGAGLLAAMTTGPYPMVKLTELVLLGQWRQPVRMHRVLTDATARQVLVLAGERWTFSDEAVRAALAARHAADLRERERAREARTALTAGARARLVAVMDARRIARARADLAAGIAFFLLLLGLSVAHGQATRTWWSLVGLFTFVAAAAGVICYVLAPRVLQPALACFQWAVVNVAPLSRRARLTGAVIAVAVAVLLIATTGPALAALAAAALPAALVAVCGGWVLLVTRRARRSGRWLGLRSHGAKPGRTGSARASWWHRRLQDAIAAVTTGTALLALARPDLLAVAPSAGLLIPVAAWASFRAWHAMNASARLAVRAAADITLSLLLAADLVLFVVWLANLLGLTPPEVVAVRSALERAGTLADLPWWLWTCLYAALSAAAVAFAIWPTRLRRAIGWFARLRVVPAINVTRRVLTGVHIGLLVIVLVAVAVPVGVFPVLRGQLASRYAVAYQRQLEAAGEQAAYAEISGQFTAKANGLVLADIVEKVHGIDHPQEGDDRATATEADIARRVGELQAAALLATGTKSVAATETAEQSAAGAAGLTVPIRDVTDLRTKVTRLDEQDKKEEAAHKRAEQAGDLAAATIASLLSVPNVGPNEVVQIIREYLSGLIEESPLKDVFASWTERLTGALRPPDAETLVVPQPQELETQALLTQIREAEEGQFAATLPSTEHESAIDAAVDLANQTRYLSEGGTGPCAGCIHLEPRDEPGHVPIEDHPVP